MDNQDTYSPEQPVAMPVQEQQVAGSVMDALQFTPRTVKEIEDRIKKPLMQAVGEMSMTALATFVMRGLKTDENGAYGAIQVYLNESNEHDTMTLQILIIDKLEKTGFLPRSLNLAEKVRNGLEKAKNEMELNMDQGIEVTEVSTLGING